MSILAPGVRRDSSSKVLRSPTCDTRAGKENFFKYADVMHLDEVKSHFQRNPAKMAI
jgi:hypothetical protein